MQDAYIPPRRYVGSDSPGYPASAVGKKLVWVLLLCRKRVRFSAVFLLAIATLLGLLAPYYQREFINGLNNQQAIKSLGRVLLLAVAMGVAAQTVTIAARILLSREGVIGQRWLSRQMYDHALNLKNHERMQKTVGETVAHFATDVTTASAVLDDFLPAFLSAIGPLVGAPIALGLFYKIPVTSVAAVTATSIGVCFAFSFRQARFFSAFKRLAEERLSIVNEWLQNLRILRVLGWVEHFESRIKKKRMQETINRLKMVTNGSVMNAIAQAAPLVINVTGVIALIRYHNPDALTPGDIFGVLWVLGVFLSRPLRMMPWTMVILLDAATSMRRLEKYFAYEVEPDPIAIPIKEKDPQKALSLTISQLTLQISNQTLLTEINLHVEPGEFIAIVGEVGSGKTLFLNSLVRDTDAMMRQYLIGENDALEMSLPELRSHFAYVAQDGFIMSASIRENIAFDYEVDKSGDDKILEALRVAQFSLQGESMADGLDTEIGERGVNLSGGQRQRIALARAYLIDRPIVLLDDCLSAVDVRTEELLLNSLILGAWKNKTRILVTHRLSVLEHADRVFVMEKGMLRAR